MDLRRNKVKKRELLYSVCKYEYSYTYYPKDMCLPKFEDRQKNAQKELGITEREVKWAYSEMFADTPFFREVEIQVIRELKSRK